MTLTLKLKPHSSARVLAGHPWIFANEVQKLLPAEYDGHVIECRDSHGHFLGSGIYNSRSQIIWRRISKERKDLDESFLCERIQKAVERRKPRNVRRLVWSEADQLPGLIVDQYEKTLVVQALTLGIYLRIEIISKILHHLFQPENIVLRNDSSILKREGLSEEVRTLYGTLPQSTWLKLGNIEFQIDTISGQKTGFYIDQQDAYQQIASFSKDRNVLDCFCNQGGFALHCAAAGAKHVTGVDLSHEALALARKNTEHNKLPTIEWVEANVFDYLRLHHTKNWDLIILDPPPFAKGKESVKNAFKGYKEIHLRAMRFLNSKGILATYCCSHHISRSLFEEIVQDAAADARRDFRILSFCHQPPDHPILLNVPETQYLHGMILEMI